MAILSIHNLKMEFADDTVLEDVSFEIAPREKVALIGANGTGKTTLFKLITGELEATEGGIYKAGNASLGYLEQHACSNSTKTLYEEMLSVFEGLMQTEARLEEVSAQIESGDGAENELIAKQNELLTSFENNGGLTYRSRTKSTLTGLGFLESDFNLACSKLSGGQRSKLCLGKLLLSGSDLLLLDEPTNHLDIGSVEWLEGFLSDFKGAAVIISHDRYFLDKVTTKTMNISNCRLSVWKGNYTEFLRQKAEHDAAERKKYEHQMDEIKHIEGIIEQQRRFGRKKNFITAESKRKMLERKLAELVKPEPAQRKLFFALSADNTSGNEVLIIDSLSKAFGQKLLFRNADAKIFKADRAFLLGPNGCGKTTMLRVFSGEQPASGGSFRFGSRVKPAYFDQSLAGLHDEKQVIDEIWDEHKSLNETRVRSLLGMFLFTGDNVYKRVGNLSGGEKAKLLLLKLMLSGANFLILDEPTNHLDINSREALEDALLSFDGTMLVVSHDRYFINKLSTKIFHMNQNGLELFLYGYDDYSQAIAARQQPGGEPVKSAKVNEYKLRKELESGLRKAEGKLRRCEEKIEQTEAEIESLSGELSNPETAADYERVLELSEKSEQLSAQLETLLAEWESLEEERANYFEKVNQQ